MDALALGRIADLARSELARRPGDGSASHAAALARVVSVKLQAAGMGWADAAFYSVAAVHHVIEERAEQRDLIRELCDGRLAGLLG